MYINNELENKNRVTICGSDADVTGKCIIKKKDSLTTVDFYYETVEWYSGLKEIFKKNTKKSST